MSTRTVTGVIVFAAIALAGCQEEGPTAPNLADAEFSLQETSAIPERPFKGSFAGTMVVLGPCGAEGQVMLHVAGEGYATHLGRTTLSIQFCHDWAAGPTEDLLAVYTAANGDEVWMRAEGEGFDMGSSEYEIWGGTGRFEDADGLLQVVGNLDLADLTWTTSVTGWIAY